MLGIYKIKLELAFHHKQVLELMKKISNVSLSRVSWFENNEVDCLRKLVKEMTNINND